MIIRRIPPALPEDYLLDRVVRRVLVRLDDLVEAERAVAEGGQVLAGHHVQQPAGVAQVVHPVDDLLKQRLFSRLGVLKGRGEDQPAAVAVLAVALVLVDGQAHGDVVQARQLILANVLRGQMPRRVAVHQRVAGKERRREHHARAQRRLAPPLKHQHDHAGNRRDDGRELDLRADKGRSRKRQRPQHAAARVFSLPEAAEAIDRHRREGEGERVGVQLRRAVQKRQARRAQHQHARLRLHAAHLPAHARAGEQPQRKEQAAHERRLHEPVAPAQQAKASENARQRVHKAQVERIAREVHPGPLDIAERPRVHDQLRGGEALLRIRDGHKPQHMRHDHLHDEIESRRAQQHTPLVPREERLVPVGCAQGQQKQRDACGRQQHKQLAAAVIQRPRRERHVEHGERVARDHQPHAEEQQPMEAFLQVHGASLSFLS